VPTGSTFNDRPVYRRTRCTLGLLMHGYLGRAGIADFDGPTGPDGPETAANRWARRFFVPAGDHSWDQLIYGSRWVYHSWDHSCVPGIPATRVHTWVFNAWLFGRPGIVESGGPSWPRRARNRCQPVGPTVSCTCGRPLLGSTDLRLQMETSLHFPRAFLLRWPR
jgi:hypothetical protein